MNSAKDKALKDFERRWRFKPSESISGIAFDDYERAIDIAVDTTRKLCEKEKEIELQEQVKRDNKLY